jgi:hypothetical protein
MGIIKEFLKKSGDLKSRFGLGIKYEDKKDSRKMKGEFFITLSHTDGREEKHHFRNVIVDSASLLISRLLADGQTSIDPTGPSHGIRVLAVGTGDPQWNPNNPPEGTSSQEGLEAELARKRFSNVTFIKTDGSGLPASQITNIVDYQTVFSESEAVGPIVELALFGGGSGSEDISLTANAGTMINYRTIAVINKPNTATMSIVFRITT